MSEQFIRRVVILGSGAVGRALAVHLVNLGFTVSLLDLTTLTAAEGLDQARPSLYVSERASEVRVAGIDDEGSGIEEAEWIVDALAERLEAKREVFARIASRIRPDAVVSTCSSALSIDDLVKGLPEDFRRQFFSASFALPLTERRLVEIRSGAETDDYLFERFEKFLADEVARRVVVVPAETSGLIARYGIWCLLLGAQVAEKLRLDVEDIDAIIRSFIGSSGIFESIDEIGLDVVRDIAQTLKTQAPEDRGSRFLVLPNSFVGLLARGWNGDGVGQGFFRREGRERLALNLTTMAYRQAKDSTLPGLGVATTLSPTERLRAALNGRDEVGEFLREFLVPCLRYAEYLREATGASVLDFDRTMEWGFGWERGPFALLDALEIGVVHYYQRNGYLSATGFKALPNDETCQSIGDCPVIADAESFKIHDLGDGIEAIAVVDGPLSPSTIDALTKLLESRALDQFVLTSQGADFPSLDLPFLYQAFRSGNTVAVDSYLGSLQNLGEILEAKRCVAAVNGRCVGAALGIALSCPIIVAVAEAEIGFYEGRLGILPTARGLALMRGLHGGSTRRMGEVAVALAEGIVAPNADTARHLGFLRPTDLTEYLPERLLATAKRVARGVSTVARPPLPVIEGPLVGIIDRGLADRRSRGGLTEHDVSVGQRIRQVVAKTGTYDECVDRERLETVEIGSKALTLARLRHMVEVGKPLRN